jgi:hypothetical protein
MKTLLLRPSPHRFLPNDIQVGWRVIDRDGAPYECWWGSCRDETALQSLIQDARAKGHEFEIEDQRPAATSRA